MSDVLERNLKAECVWRGKRLIEIRDALTCINDELEDEGDRVYFASTNHADQFRDMVERLEDFGWSLVIKDKSEPDYINDLAKARDAVRANEALIKDLVEALEPFAELSQEGSDDHADDTVVTTLIGRVSDFTLTLKDLRRATTVWAKAEARHAL